MGSPNSKQATLTAEEKSKAEIENFVAKHGVAGIDKLFKEKINAWKDVKLNFAIAGESGAGKSSYINAVRGLNDKDEDAAAIGVTETTTKPAEYSHPNNPNIKFWDLPGIGTPTYSNIEKYCEAIDLKKYDAILIFSEKRFRKHDSELATKANFFKTPFFFIRTHIHSDCKNALEREGIGREKTVETVRRNCYENLENLLTSELDIFVIDNHVREMYDFDRLLHSITNVLPERRKECFVLSLSNLTRDCLIRKAGVLRAQAGLLSLASAATSAIPVPVVGATIDLALMMGESYRYRKSFGIPEKDSNEYNWLKEEWKKTISKYCLKTSTDLVREMGLKSAIAEIGEEVAKYIPGPGTVVACALSYANTSYYLIRCINDLEKIALQIWDKIHDANA